MFEEQRPLRLIDQKASKDPQKAEKRGQRGVVFQAGLRWIGIIKRRFRVGEQHEVRGRVPGLEQAELLRGT